MKIIVAPDKFKGSLTSMQVCEAIKTGIHEVFPRADVLLFPMADGGDGFDEVLQYYLQTETITCQTVDPLLRPIHATYQLNTFSKTAMIALSSASGLVLLKDEECNPMYTTTFGSGLRIKHAIEQGAKKIILGLGGSATNDAGIGILEALGFQLVDIKGDLISHVGGNLQTIHRIIQPAFIPSINFQIACDVENILFGKGGASFIYAKQKGASSDDIIYLNKGLEHIAEIISAQTGKSIGNVPGTGAAGGVAAGLMAFFDCDIISGTKLVLEASDILEKMVGANLIITGEGKFDSQSSNGKVIEHISKLGNQFEVPVIALCGITDVSQSEIQDSGLTAAYQLVNESISQQFAIANAEKLLIQLSQSVLESFFRTS